MNKKEIKIHIYDNAMKKMLWIKNCSDDSERLCFIKHLSQPAKLDLNKKSFPKQKIIQNFTIDAQGFRKTKNENPPTWKMGVTS